MRIVSVVGNRPQFIKAAAVSGELRKQHEELLVHTGQHYDDGLSAIFFDELDLPRPERELSVGSGTHAQQTAAIMARLEPVLDELQPQLTLVYGDTNSTLAAALTSVKLQIPIAHVEAGMRSFDRTMPEEVNRVLTDHISDLLFCSSGTAVENLESEGISRGVHEIGDVMIDVALRSAPVAAARSDAVDRYGLQAGEYLLVTAHRPGNVDGPESLSRLVELLESLPQRAVFPVHPRTRLRLSQYGLLQRLEQSREIALDKPLGYLDLLQLLQSARAVLTDSGGLQKEAYLFGVQCVTLRETTEWVETVETGWNHTVGLDKEAALAALQAQPPTERPQLYGGGKAAVALAEVISDRAVTLRN